jgi:hypothetical protein
MSWLDELAWLMEDRGVVAATTDVFLSEKDEVPDGAGPFLSIRETGGIAPEKRQDVDVAYQRPAAQLLVTAQNYQAARAVAKAAYDACLNVHNEMLDSTYYVAISPLQEPFGLPLDGNKRARVAFNVLGDKRPS